MNRIFYFFLLVHFYSLGQSSTLKMIDLKQKEHSQIQEKTSYSLKKYRHSNKQYARLINSQDTLLLIESAVKNYRYSPYISFLFLGNNKKVIIKNECNGGIESPITCGKVKINYINNFDSEDVDCYHYLLNNFDTVVITKINNENSAIPRNPFIIITRVIHKKVDVYFGELAPCFFIEKEYHKWRIPGSFNN